MNGRPGVRGPLSRWTPPSHLADQGPGQKDPDPYRTVAGRGGPGVGGSRPSGRDWGHVRRSGGGDSTRTPLR